MPDRTVVHTPRYLLRRRIILEALAALPRGTFLETGCGRGELLPWLDRIGFHGVGLEISESVLPIAKAAAAPLAPRIEVVGSPDELAGRRFDYLLTFEVLEHIEDDRGVLAQWLEHLSPTGRVVLTVPAHQKLWSASDDAVGHVRRYERAGLTALLESVDLEVERFWTYGYPLVWITRPLRHLLYRLRRADREDRDAEARTLDSSLDSTVRGPRPARRILAATMEAVGLAFHHLGRPFWRTDHGDGYLVVARRRPS